MKRHHVILSAVVLALLGALVPISAMLHFSWNLAVRGEQAKLEHVARSVLARSNLTVAGAKAALRAMAVTPYGPCSADHILEMRRLALNNRSIDEVGYFANGRLKCTSWGPTTDRIMMLPSDYSTADGIAVTVKMWPMVSGAEARMTLQNRDYNVLIDPVRLLDLIVDPGIQLAVGTDQGAVIGTQSDPDLALVKSLLLDPRKGMDDRQLFAAAGAEGLVAVAIESQVSLLERFRRERNLLLPLGIFLGVAIVGCIIWLSRRRLSPLGELAIAVRNREFIVHYQPIIELKTGTCVGAEALVRWRQPDGSLVRPDLFVPLAEESGLIMPITDQIVEAVVRDMKSLLVANTSLHIAINLCAEDIKTGRALAMIQQALATTGIRAEQIWLEATERGFIDIDQARDTVAKARRLGHSVAIDDFGTGYSSLQYLQGLPLDSLKIDKFFIDTIGRNTATSSVTPHIIEMAKALRLVIVAEGVETGEQLDYLREHGVEFAQGWLFSRPLAAADFIAYYQHRKPSHVMDTVTLSKSAS